MSDELKPCPFCGAEASLIGGRIHAKHSQFCILYSQVVYDFKKTSWNTRPIEDDLRAKLAIATEALEKATRCQEHRAPTCAALAAEEALSKIKA